MSIIRHENEIKDLQRRVAELEAELKKLADRKKPGPKPKEDK